jgi:hypothetical protein
VEADALIGAVNTFKGTSFSRLNCVELGDIETIFNSNILVYRITEEQACVNSMEPVTLISSQPAQRPTIGVIQDVNI